MKFKNGVIFCLILFLFLIFSIGKFVNIFKAHNQNLAKIKKKQLKQNHYCHSQLANKEIKNEKLKKNCAVQKNIYEIFCSIKSQYETIKKSEETHLSIYDIVR